MLAERAQASGGVLVARMASLLEHETTEADDDDVDEARTSLHDDMERYSKVIQGVRERVKLVNNLGDDTTEEPLRDVLETMEANAHHCEHSLVDVSLGLWG
jgi:starvation-inducible DNA-binding protein